MNLDQRSRKEWTRFETRFAPLNSETKCCGRSVNLLNTET